jgi:hypothetical protein
MSILYRGPFTDASYQILIHLAKRLEKIFLEINESEKRLVLTNMATIDNSCFWLADFYKNLLFWNRLAKWTETW